MASLQQLNFRYVDSHQEPDQAIIAIHRRGGVIANYILNQGLLEFFECKSWSDTHWKKVDNWRFTDVFQTIIHIVALECYDVFAVLGTTQSESMICLIGFDGSIRTTQKISTMPDLCCGDYNQRTREFVVAFSNGVILCLFTKMISKFEYHLTRRKVSKLAAADYANHPVQLVTQDLMNMVLVLTSSGHIFCLDIAKFDVVYSVSAEVFALMPTRIWADKFGTDFVVQCTSKNSNKEQLEYWHPPEDYTSCRSGMFGRIAIPLPAPLLSLTIETLGLYGAKTLLGITTVNKKVHLWSTSGDSSLLFESDIKLNVPANIWQSTQHLITSGKIAAKEFPTLLYQFTLLSFVPSGRKNDHLYNSIMLTSVGKATIALGVHTVDEIEHAMNLVFMDLEIKKMQDEASKMAHMPMQSMQLVEESNDLLSAFQSLHRSMDDRSRASSHDDQHSLQAGSKASRSSYRSRDSVLLGSEDDDKSVMSETLAGALSSIAEMNKSIDDLINAANDDNSLSTGSLTPNEKQSRQGHSTPLTPVNGSRHTTSDVPISVNPMFEMQDPYDLGSHQSSFPSFSLQRLGQEGRTLTVPANSNSLQVYPEIETKYFYPSFYTSNKDISKCNLKINPTSINLLIQPNCILVDHNSDLLTFNLSGLVALSPSYPKLRDDSFQVKYFAIAYRIGHVLIVSEVKEYLLYSFRVFESIPLRLPLSLRLQASVSAAICADVFLYAPESIVANGKNAVKANSSSKVQIIANEFDRYTFCLFGDDQGFVHAFICDGGDKVVQSDVFRAHSTAIEHLVVTGDCTRPLWCLGSELVDGSQNVMAVSMPGSAIITVSKEGEVKTWLPFTVDTNKGSSFDKFFNGNIIKWKCSGLYVASQPSPNTIPYSKSALPLEHSKKQKSVESVALAPSCMTLILGFNNGQIEEWNIPGLIETNDSVLSTAQRPLWSTTLHHDAVVSIRSYVHGPLSSVKQFVFRPDQDRDAQLATLSCFARVPNRVRRTVGLTFQEMKNIMGSSSMVSCSLDRSLILWGFQASFFGHCNIIHPYPCKKFYFSTAPLQGLAFCLNTVSGNTNHPHNPWRLDAIVEGKVVTIINETRSKLFIPFEQEMVDDYRFLAMEETNIISFEDELMFERTGKSAATKQKRTSLTTIPVIGKVHKASQLVSGYQSYGKAFSSNQPSHDLSLFNLVILEQWAKLGEKLIPPVVSSVHFSEDEIKIIPIQDWKPQVDVEDIPVRPITPVNFAEYVTEQAVKTIHIPTLHLNSAQPRSPSPINIPFISKQEFDDEELDDEDHSRNHDDTKKFKHNGIYMEANLDQFADLQQHLTQHVNERYVVQKSRPSSGLTRNHSPDRPDSETIFAMKKYEFPGGHDMFYTDELTETPTVTDKSHLTEKIPSPIASRPNTAGTERSDASGRTQFSVESVSFSKQSKVVKTITIHDGNEINDLQKSPVFAKESKKDLVEPDNVSVITDGTHRLVTKPTSPKHFTRSAALRQQAQNKIKERFELVENYVGPSFGDSRKAAKSLYTSKNSMVKEDLKPFQGGTRQQLGKNNTTAPSPAGHNAKNVVMINSQTNLNILGGKPLQVAVTNAVMEIDKPILTEPIEEAKDITSLTEDTLPPPDAQAPAVHEEKPPMLTMDHPVIANHGPAAKFVLKKEKPQTVRIVQSMLKVEDKKVKEVAPPITKETITKHEQSNSPNNSTVKNSIFDDDSTLCDDQSVQSSLQSISSMGHAEQKSKVLNAHGHHASKKSGRPPSPQHVAPYVLPRKPQAVALDLPDQKSLINQKHAAMLAKNLSQRGVSIDQSPLQKIIFKHEKRERKSIAARDHDEDDFEESVDTDDESLVDGYFDRNAKPIFVERKNRIKSTQKPKSKRQGVVTEVDDTDDYSNLQDNSLDLFMDSLDEDDRKMLANMSEEDRKKLISELNATKKKGQINTKLLKSLTSKFNNNAKEQALLDMDLTIEPIETADMSFTVSAASQSGGSVYLVLTKFADASKVNLSYFVDETSVPKIPGYIDHRTISLDPRSFQEVTFDQLHPVTSYSVSAVINLSSLITKPKPNEVPYVVDTSKIQTVWNFGVETLEEQLDIEWWRLDQNMRVTELRAAVRSEFVQMKAHHNYPPILLPSDDDLLSSECMHVLNLQMDSPQLSGAKKKLKPHLLLFYDWWVGSGRKTTKVRSEFHSLECIHAIVHHKSFMHEFLEEGFADSDECQVLVDYVKKQTNPRRASISAPSDIQKIRSSISAAADDMMSMKSTVSGASNMSAIMNEKGLQLMKRFRSWYKGGQVVKDFEETEHKRLTTLLPSDDEQSTYSTTSEGSAVDVVEHESLCTKRLVQRNKFLVQLIKQVQDCTTQVSRLHDGYKYAVTKSLKESDLMYERANLSNKEVSSIMSSKKFLELCYDYEMLERPFIDIQAHASDDSSQNSQTSQQKIETPPFKMLELTTFDAFKCLASKFPPNVLPTIPQSSAMSTPVFVIIQRLAGVDIFRTGSVETLKADDPPTVNITCLPGTNRRPIKPWQLMSRVDQDIEVAVACCLDAVWELAVADGVEVPEPEDRVLDSKEFPQRKRVWEDFREWYAGDEDSDPVPGKGVPTLARVIFAEQYESPQVEKDPYVVNLMREKHIPLPKYYRGDSNLTSTSITATNIKNDKEELRSVGEKSFNDSLGSLQRGGPPPLTSNPSGLQSSTSLDEFQTLVQAYEKAINTSKASFLRTHMFGLTLNTVFRGRKMNLIKYVWPPAMQRMGLQFLFPRVGLIIPKFSLPLKRYPLFASRSKECYNVDEIMQWYSNSELDVDDIIMMKAEAKGARLRAYHEWLSHEPERVADSRLNMGIEDEVARQLRAVHQIIEERFQNVEQKLADTDEFLEEHLANYTSSTASSRASGIQSPEQRRSAYVSSMRNSMSLDPVAEHNYHTQTSLDVVLQDEDDIMSALHPGLAHFQAHPNPQIQEDSSGLPFPKSMLAGIDPNIASKLNFRLMSNLPREYWYIFEESVEFRHGSGLFNEDEVEEMRILQEQLAKKAVQDAEAFEKYLVEEKKKRDQEERNRLKREEQDRRLKEGLARRRQIRENLEEIKRQRLIKKEEELLEQLRIMEEARLQKEAEEAERQRIADLEKQEQRRVEECEAMALEETYTRDCKVRFIELKHMEQEDIMSFLREHHEVQLEVIKQQRIKELEEIYAPFTPFQFKESRIKLPALHQVLKDESEIAADAKYLEDVNNMMRNPSSPKHNRSDVYFSSISLQGRDTESRSRQKSKRYDDLYGGVDAQAELESIISSRSSATNSPTRVSTARSQNTVISPPKKGDILIQREVDHSPSKKHVRELVSQMVKQEGSNLSFNPYDSEWQLSNKFQPAVLTTAVPYFSRPNSPTGAGTTLNPKNFSRPVSRHHSPKMARDEDDVYDQVLNDPSLYFHDIPRSIFTSSSRYGPSDDRDEQDPHGIDYSDSVSTPSAAQQKTVSFQPEQAPHPFDTLTVDIPSSNHSFDSLFHSFMEDGATNDGDLLPIRKISKSRKKLKELLSLSADVIAKSSQKDWLNYVETQKQLTMASLVSLEAQNHLRSMNPILSSMKTQNKLVKGQLPSLTAPNLHQLHEPKESSLDRLSKSNKSKVMSVTVPAELSLIDSKTRKLAKSASESVIKLQQQRETLRQYVTGNVAFEDSFYLLAAEGGVKHSTSLEASREIQKFAEEIEKKIENPDMHAEVASDKAVKKPIKINIMKKGKQSLIPVFDSIEQSLSAVSSVSLASSNTSPQIVPARAIPSKSKNSLGIITGSTMKLEKDNLRGKRLKPVVPPKQAALSSSQSSTSSRDNLVPASALSTSAPTSQVLMDEADYRPTSSKEIRPGRSLDLFIKTPRASELNLPLDTLLPPGMSGPLSDSSRSLLSIDQSLPPI